MAQDGSGSGGSRQATGDVPVGGWAIHNTITIESPLDNAAPPSRARKNANDAFWITIGHNTGARDINGHNGYFHPHARALYCS